MAQPRTSTTQDDARPPRQARTTRTKPSGPRRSTAPATQGKVAEPDLDALKRQLLETVASHYPQADLEPVGQAFDVAVEAHAGQMRATGEPYVTHPIASAQITAELGIDPVAIQAA